MFTSSSCFDQMQGAVARAQAHGETNGHDVESCIHRRHNVVMFLWQPVLINLPILVSRSVTMPSHDGLECRRSESSSRWISVATTLKQLHDFASFELPNVHTHARIHATLPIRIVLDYAPMTLTEEQPENQEHRHDAAKVAVFAV